MFFTFFLFKCTHRRVHTCTDRYTTQYAKAFMYWMETFINRTVQFQLIKIQLKCRAVLLFLLKFYELCSPCFSFILASNSSSKSSSKVSFFLCLPRDKHSINYYVRPPPFEFDRKSINHKRLSEPNMVGAGHERFAAAAVAAVASIAMWLSVSIA